MSLITAYFKKEANSIDAILPEISHHNGSNEVKCPDSVNHSVDLLTDEDSNLKMPTPPKKMKIALFESHEPPTSDNIEATQQLNDKVVQLDMVEGEAALTLTSHKETEVNVEDCELHEQATAQLLPKQQSRQTTLKFENGKCLLVPMTPSTVMDVVSQESSQADSTAEDEYYPKKQQRKKRKKNKCNNSNEEICSDNIVEEVETTKKPGRKAAKQAVKQLTELLQEPVPPHKSSMNGKSTSEGDQVKPLPEILVIDSDSVIEIVDNKNDDVSKSIAKEGAAAAASSPVVVAKEVIMGDSSDSDVICLTPRSASPLSQESTAASRPSSRPATPVKNKWSHIFGSKSPQRKSSPNRKSSPRKCSPRKSNPIKHVTMTSGTSHEHYTLGIPLFHHIMQKDASLLWDLPKVELSSINTSLTNLSSRCQATRVPPHDNHLRRKELLHLEGDIQKKPLTLKVKRLLFVLYSSLMCNLYHILYHIF